MYVLLPPEVISLTNFNHNKFSLTIQIIYEVRMMILEGPEGAHTRLKPSQQFSAYISTTVPN